MTKDQIRIGGVYRAKISGRLVDVRVLAVSPTFEGLPGYDVVNLLTGRKTRFRSAAKFRTEVHQPRGPVQGRTYLSVDLKDKVI